MESEQNYLRDKYTNIATIATFFSSITASTLQFSFDQETSNLWVIVNTFWFLSLVSSIASAANALLAITWHKSLRYDLFSQPAIIVNVIHALHSSYSVRRLQASILVGATDKDRDREQEEKKRTKTLDRWFDSCPMAFLVASGALFMIGLAIFTYASLQVCSPYLIIMVNSSC